MGLKLFSINHRDHGFAVIELLSPWAQADLELRLVEAGAIDGCIVLATCNRLEILIDTPDPETATRNLYQLLPAPAAPGADFVAPREISGAEVISHLCELACGLDSMVVGEREITGQLRYAARRASRLKTITAPLADAVDTALKAARIVEKETGLSGMGRSVAAVALNHVEDIIGDYRTATVMLFGTGSYAGAVVTHLQARGCKNIYVHSNSGRAQAFAQGRGLKPVDNRELGRVLGACDLVVSCRGIGAPTVTFDHVSTHVARRPETHPLAILDLAVVRDVDPRVGELPGVRLVDLETVRHLVPELEPALTQRARELAAQVAAEHQQRQAARQIDPVIVSMRSAAEQLVAEELQHLPNRQLSAADCERALRRLANRILHTPTTVAKTAGAQGQAEQFIAALELVTGIEAPSETKEPM
ncbi:MAG: glutamyl-tRNA reductase [Actinomycetaceae bacterium]|nr:glutamyl-tRNA reductase [Actinomycetaceae bacterium]